MKSFLSWGTSGSDLVIDRVGYWVLDWGFGFRFRVWIWIWECGFRLMYREECDCVIVCLAVCVMSCVSEDAWFRSNLTNEKGEGVYVYGTFRRTIVSGYLLMLMRLRCPQ